MPPNNYRAGKDDPLTLRQYDAQTYGPVADLPASARIVAQPVNIMQIRPDMRQPRRYFPAAFRVDWDGDPEEVPDMLSKWHLAVEEKLARTLALEKLARGVGDGLEYEKSDDRIVSGYIELLKLAASIYADGLVNPIRLARSTRGAATHLIESGERRWLAYHLLNLHVSGDYATIPAVEKPRLDVWAQAAENGARAPLNAVGMARQIALLIMDMYAPHKDVSFDPYEVMVLPGEVDRKYYAQVARGDLYPIIRGMGQRVLDVTGLKSMEAVRQYRALLRIPDGLWVKADDQDWTEWQVREYVDAADSIRSVAITDERSVTPVTPQPDPAPALEGETFEERTALQKGEQTVLQAARDWWNHGPDAAGWFTLKTPGFESYRLVVPHLLLRSLLETRTEAGKPLYRLSQMGKLALDKADSKAAEAAQPTLSPPSASAPLHKGSLVLNPGGSVLEVVSVDAHTTWCKRPDGELVGIVADALTLLDLNDPAVRLTDAQLADVRLLNVAALKEWQDMPHEPTVPPADANALSRAYPHGFGVGDKVRIVGNPAVGEVIEVTREKICVRRPNPTTPGVTMTHWVIPEKVTMVAARSSTALAPEKPEKEHNANPRPAGNPALEALYPRESYVVRLDNGRIGRVRSYIAAPWDELCVADPALPAWQMLMDWKASDVRAATPAEVAAPNALPPPADPPRESAFALFDRASASLSAAHDARPLESAAPILDAWPQPELAPILRLLKTLAKDKKPTQIKIDELMTLSRRDLAGWVSDEPDSLPIWIADAERRLTDLVTTAVTAALQDYLDHLHALGQELREQVRGASPAD